MDGDPPIGGSTRRTRTKRAKEGRGVGVRGSRLAEDDDGRGVDASEVFESEFRVAVGRDGVDAAGSDQHLADKRVRSGGGQRLGADENEGLDRGVGTRSRAQRLKGFGTRSTPGCERGQLGRDVQFKARDERREKGLDVFQSIKSLLDEDPPVPLGEALQLRVRSRRGGLNEQMRRSHLDQPLVVDIQERTDGRNGVGHTVTERCSTDDLRSESEVDEDLGHGGAEGREAAGSEGSGL